MNKRPARPAATSAAKKRPRRRSRRGGGAKKTAEATAIGASHAAHKAVHSSQPTTRVAYAETRKWLLDKHGPVCAYCEQRFPVRTMTLDHVTARKGQSAYDRRDNLVLACKACNAAKADKSIMAFLLGRKSRAESLLRYGDHLSPMLLDLARQLAGPEAVARVAKFSDPDYPYRD